MGNGLHHRWSESERKLRPRGSRRNGILGPGHRPRLQLKSRRLPLPRAKSGLWYDFDGALLRVKRPTAEECCFWGPQVCKASHAR